MEIKEEKNKMLSLLAKVSSGRSKYRKRSYDGEKPQPKISRKIGKSNHPEANIYPI